MSNRYIIVDDPEHPTRYWSPWGFVSGRKWAIVYTEEQRNEIPSHLPEDGCWLLVDEGKQSQVEAQGGASRVTEGSPRPALAKGATWEVGPRPLDVLAGPHVPGLEINCEKDSCWIAIASGHDEAERIVRDHNAYESDQRLIEALTHEMNLAIEEGMNRVLMMSTINRCRAVLALVEQKEKQ